jgi:hypothetical protein
MGTETVNQWQQRLALGLEHPSSSGRSWLQSVKHKVAGSVSQYREVLVNGNASFVPEKGQHIRSPTPPRGGCVLDRLKQQMVRGRTCCS